MRKKICDIAKQTLCLAVGSTLCALAVKAVIIPMGLLSTGLTGASLVLFYRVSTVSVETIYLLVNIPVLLLGWRYVGYRFIAYSFLGIVFYALALHVVDVRLTISDPMLGAMLAGCVSGVGVAVVLKSHGSTGGTEILCVILNKLFGVSVGSGSLIINGIVLTAAAFLFPIETVLYALVYAVVYMLTLDKLFYGLAERKTALIISDHWRTIMADLMRDCSVGVTKIDCCGGYQGAEQTILYSVINQIGRAHV